MVRVSGLKYRHCSWKEGARCVKPQTLHQNSIIRIKVIISTARSISGISTHGPEIIVTCTHACMYGCTVSTYLHMQYGYY